MTTTRTADRRRELAQRASTLLPEPGASADAYAAAVERLRSQEVTDVVRAALSELQRRADDPVPAPHLHAAIGALRSRLVTDRRAETREAVLRRERKQPLRAALLAALAERESTPSELAERLGYAKETVSRALRLLVEDGSVAYVADPDDARKRRYAGTEAVELHADDAAGGPAALTRLGGRTHADHLLYGQGSPAADADGAPPAVRTARYIDAQIAEAVVDRRHRNQHDEARGRFEMLARSSRRAGALPQEIRALRELAVTLRQSARAAEHARAVAQLRALAFGERAGSVASAALPAYAHVLYEEGRAADAQDADRALSTLGSAAETFDRLRATHPEQGQEWAGLTAWSLYGAADVLRRRTDYEAALASADRAATVFADVGDDYGTASCLFLAGFCLRLRGEYEPARRVIVACQRRATEAGFDRLNAECLMQLGEVERSCGAFETAVVTLVEARDRAAQLRHHTTEAFATTALGAVAFDTQDYPQAVDHLRAADVLFRDLGHRAGIALNQRRLAVTFMHASGLETTGTSTWARQLQAAEGRFAALGSPAGVVSCRVARVRGTLPDRPREAAKLAEALAAWLLKAPGTVVDVARDPWAPELLGALAAELGDEGLRALDAELRVHVRGQRATSAVHRIGSMALLEPSLATLLDAPAPPVVGRHPDLMAGEHRMAVGRGPFETG